MLCQLVAATALSTVLSHEALSPAAAYSDDYTPSTSHAELIDDRPVFDEIIAGLRNIAGLDDSKEDNDFLASKTCSNWDNKCKKCADQKTCAYCYAGGTCTDNSRTGTLNCPHKKGWITSKRKCDGYLTWWAILLIVLACVCLCPLISFLCFVYVIKKFCC